MSENPFQLDGNESYHEVLIAKAVFLSEDGSVEGAEKELEAIKESRNLPQDSKDKNLGNEGTALKAFDAKLSEILGAHAAEANEAREALNVMISRANARNQLAALIDPASDPEGDAAAS